MPKDASKKRPFCDTESHRVLLTGDSILDCRAYVDRTPAQLLEDMGAFVVDASVECTKAKHLQTQKTRSVPLEWYTKAQGTSSAHRQRVVDLFPSGHFDIVFVSAGGNDIILASSGEHRGMLEMSELSIATLLASRINAAMDRYAKLYPRVVYLPPYGMNKDGARSLLEFWGLPVSESIVNFAQTRLNSVRRLTLDLITHEKIDIDWADEDSAVSDQGVPEPTQRGANRIADAPRCSETHNTTHTRQASVSSDVFMKTATARNDFTGPRRHIHSFR